MSADTQIAPGRSNEWLLDRPLALAIATTGWLGFAIMAWLVIHAQTVVFDEAGLLLWRIEGSITPTGPASLTALMLAVTDLGGVPVRSLAAISAALLLVLLKRQRNAAWLALTVVTGWIINSGMKWIFARGRPDIVPHLTEAGGYSFPSGHSFNSAVVYFGIALTFAAITKSSGRRIAMIVTAAMLSLFIACSRVWLGVHFPSDIIAGWLAGTGWVFLAYGLFPPRSSTGN